MANELNLRVTFTSTKAGSVGRNIQGLFNVASTPFVQSVQNIPTTDATLDLNAIGTIGYVFLHNLDPTNYISIGSDGSSYPIVLLPGDFGIVRWNAAAIHAKSHTAACDLEYVALSL